MSALYTGLLYANNMQKRMAYELNCKTSNATKKIYSRKLKEFLAVERSQRNNNKKDDSNPTKAMSTNSTHENTTPNKNISFNDLTNSNQNDQDGLGGDGEECVEGEVWWPWEAYHNVISKMKEMKRRNSSSSHLVKMNNMKVE